MGDLTKVTLEVYLTHLEKKWKLFQSPLFPLDVYLSFGETVWREANLCWSLPINNNQKGETS